MIRKSVSRLCVWSIFLVLLVACQATSTEIGPTSAPIPTITASPPPTVTPIPAISNTAEQTPAIEATVQPSHALDGLRMAYIVDGNLYFQKGSKPPLQLTHGGEVRSPILFAQEGEKILFSRGIVPNSLYSINSNGSDEKAVVTNDMLISINSLYNESTTLCEPTAIPRTSFLLFHTCSHPNGYTTIHNDDLFIVDTSTNQVKSLYALGQGGIYYVSPDGTMLAVDRSGYIDIVGIDGKMLHHKVATYILSEPIPLVPFVYWKSDASELVMVLPTNTHYDTAPDPRYQAWHYLLAAHAGTQVNLDHPPLGTDPIRVSPDGNWILYTNYDDGSFYLGNLRNGHTQSYESLQAVFGYEWNPDSTHFVYGVPKLGGRGISLGSVNAPPRFIGKGDFIGWLDASCYLYIVDGTILMGEIGGETTSILTNIPTSLFPDNPAGFIFTYE